MMKSIVLAGFLGSLGVIACSHPAPEPAPTPARGSGRPVSNAGPAGPGANGAAGAAAQFVPPADEARGLLRGELIALDSQLRDALPRAGDPDTRAHLVNARHRIDVILNPNK